MNGFEIKYKVIGDTIVFVIVEDGMKIAGVFATYFKNEIFTKDAIKIVQTWVDKDYQRRGIMMGVYEAIHKYYVLISDGFLSPESKNLWGKIIKKNVGEVKMIHMRSMRIENEPSFDERYNMLFLWE